MKRLLIIAVLFTAVSAGAETISVNLRRAITTVGDPRYVNVSGDTMTAPLLGSAGTAAAPSFGFTGEADTGFYLAGVNSPGVATAGAARWSWSAAGAFNPATANTYDIGSAAAIRDIAIGRNAIFSGATSGTTTLAATAIAGTTALTLPAATDTLVGRDTTDTLTNKSVSGATNTLSAIPNAALTNSSVTIGATTVPLGGTAATIGGLTLNTPTIANFTNATHTHADATNGGQISGATALSEGTSGTGAFARAGSPTFTGAPVLAAPTATTIETSGNVGFGVAPSGNAGDRILTQNDGNQLTRGRTRNADASSTGAGASWRSEADTAVANMLAYGTANTSTQFGVTVGGYVSFLASAGNGILFGTNAGPIIFGTNSSGKGAEMSNSSTPQTAFGGNAPDGTGRLQVQMGSSSGNAKVGGSEFASTTSVGNVGTGEDDLFSYTTLTNQLANDHANWSFIASGTFAANVNTKQLRVRAIEGANNNLIFDSGALSVTGGGEWSLSCDILRSTSTALKSVCRLTTTGAALTAYTDYFNGTFTFANAGTIKITAEATSNNDVVAELWKGWWSPAP